MNTPTPPTPPKTGNAVTASAPTIGATVGVILGQYIAAKLHIADPVQAGAFITVATTIVTAVFHALGQKFGINLLG